MSELLSATPAAINWLDQSEAKFQKKKHFGEIRSAVVWSGATGPDGKLIVDIDPQILVASLNSGEFPLLLRHDPGHPLGKILEAAVFTSPSGEVFVAATMGLYAGRRLSFGDFGFDPEEESAPLTRLPEIPDNIWIDLAADSREIADAWIDSVIGTTSVKIKKVNLSHNAQKSPHQLIRVGVLFMALVWNPYVTTIASEAGKDTYANIHNWLVDLTTRISDLDNPILDIQSYHDNCEISFLLRGRNAKITYAAMAKISSAASQAARLIAKMKQLGEPPKTLIYEFDGMNERWFPSYAELQDGRLVTDNEKLIVIEELPSGLSLGLIQGTGKPGNK